MLTSEISPREAFTALSLAVLPILTYLGSIWNTAYYNNSLLLVAILLVSLLAFVTCLPGNLVPEKFYPLVIATVSICLLFHVLWMSPYLVGWDVNLEYFLFELVKSSGHWNVAYPLYYNSALSVTILPVLVQSILAADDTALFKTMYPLAFSLVPVILFLAYKNIVDSKRAFVSAIFLSSYTAYFTEVDFIGKQEIAEVIIALLILLTLSSGSKAKRLGRSLTMILLIVGLVISHYSSAYLYLSFLFLSWLVLAALKRRRVISPLFVTFFALLAFCWYIYTSGGAAFAGLVQFGYQVFSSMISDFFVPATRGGVVLQFFGIGVRPALVNRINLLVQYSIQGFIVVGVVGLWKRRKSVNGEFLSYAFISLSLLILSVVLPYFASGLNESRIYQFALIFLSPACVLGGESIFRTLFRAISTLRTRSWHVSLPNSNRSLTFTSCIIILFLLFNTGFINEISGAPPISFSLGFNRMRESNDQALVTFLYDAYFTEQDYRGARWMSIYMVHNQSVCGDYASRFYLLLSYGGIPLEKGGAAVPLLYPGLKPSCMYVYLSYKNVMKGFGSETQARYRISEVSALDNGRNRIYSNGGSVILVFECQSNECA
jgi:uncharacterized membrane protein